MPADAFPDGVYNIAASGSDLERLTGQGHQLVRILSGSHAVTFLVMRRRDQVHEELLESMTNLNHEITKERIATSDAKREVFDVTRDKGSRVAALAKMEKEYAALADLFRRVEGERDNLEKALGESRLERAQVAVHFGDRGAADFDEHLVAIKMAKEDGVRHGG